MEEFLLTLTSSFYVFNQVRLHPETDIVLHFCTLLYMAILCLLADCSEGKTTGVRIESTVTAWLRLFYVMKNAFR